ncbi:cilia- and flagella-associated protein 100-like [Pygocentrus nattereri]|uniref:cilia- and flagella-associated protein 100-like n=1 Tax=Pygocentrus nattereri TaxID=42514 RepID=UPI0008145A3F|nr:cilia- and flagella-associated protein 100-like [Pygocentrus nattereri]
MDDSTKLVQMNQAALRLTEPSTFGFKPQPPQSEVKPQSDGPPFRRNPFKLPTIDIFQLRKQEEERRRLERSQEQIMKPHEKLTYKGRVRAKCLSIQQELRRWVEDEETTCTSQEDKSLQRDPKLRKVFRHYHSDKTSLNDYIANQRETFQLKLFLDVRQGTIDALMEEAALEEERLTLAEKLLDEDICKFDEFLKECDWNLVQSIKIAEDEVKAKLEKKTEIKQIHGKIMAVKSDISKKEEILKEYKMYRDFLLKLSPPEWQEKQRIRKQTAEKIKAAAKESELALHTTTQQAQSVQLARRRDFVSNQPLTTTKAQAHGQNISIKVSIKPKWMAKVVEEVMENMEHYEDPEIYFTDSQQLLDLLEELKFQSVIQIQNTAEMDEDLDEFCINMNNRCKRMEQEIAQLAQQVDIFTHAIQREKETTEDLKLKSRLFSFGEYKAKDQDLMLEKLRKKVAEVYRSCLGLSDGGQSTLQMLTTIEWRLSELLEHAETLPRDRLISVERAQAKERRIREREERAHLQKLAQEERQRRMMHRAMADIKKPTGKRLMPRSKLLKKVTKAGQDDQTADAELENSLYFFS